MALRATLEADFGAGGFSLSGTVEGLGGDLDGVAVPEVPLDTDALAAADDGLGAVDVSAAAGPSTKPDTRRRPKGTSNRLPMCRMGRR